MFSEISGENMGRYNPWYVIHSPTSCMPIAGILHCSASRSSAFRPNQKNKKNPTKWWFWLCRRVAPSGAFSGCSPSSFPVLPDQQCLPRSQDSCATPSSTYPAARCPELGDGWVKFPNRLESSSHPGSISKDLSIYLSLSCWTTHRINIAPWLKSDWRDCYLFRMACVITLKHRKERTRQNAAIPVWHLLPTKMSDLMEVYSLYFFAKAKKNACGTTKQFWTQIIQNIKIHEFSSGTFKKKENYPNLVSGCFQSPRSSNPLALLTPSLRCNSNRLSTPWFMQLFKGGGWSWWLEVLDTWLQWIQKPGIFGTGNLKRKKVQNHLRLKSVGWEKNMWSFSVG